MRAIGRLAVRTATKVPTDPPRTRDGSRRPVGDDADRPSVMPHARKAVVTPDAAGEVPDPARHGAGD